MTARDKINEQIKILGKKILIVMLGFGLMGMTLLFLSQKRGDASGTIIILGMMATGCFFHHLFFRAFVIKCPFCKKEIPWFPKKDRIDILSEESSISP